jgi:hypothetical protein
LPGREDSAPVACIVFGMCPLFAVGVGIQPACRIQRAAKSVIQG